MQGLGHNNIEAIPTASVTMETDLSNSLSTLSSNFSNIYKTVERLVEVQEKQIEIQRKHNDFMRKTFDKLIECISRGFTVESARSNLFLDERSDDFDIREEQHDGSLAVLLKRPDGTNRGVNLPPSSDIFKDIGGATRKTEEKNPPIQLLEVLVVAGWNVLLDDKQKFIIPFLLDWSSRDRDINYVQNWFSELECWSCGQNLVRKVCAAVVLVDTKPCVAIFYKYYDDEEDTMKPRLTLLAPQSLKNTELPLKELQALFEAILGIGRDNFVYDELKVQKVFPLDENSKIQNSVVATGVKVKDFMLNFSVEKRARARNELSDALFWFVIVCCCGRKSENIFSGLKDQLVGYHTKDDPAGYRRSVCDAVYDCAIFLAERKLVSLKTDYLGVANDDNANIDDFIVMLRKQKESMPNSGEIQYGPLFFISYIFLTMAYV